MGREISGIHHVTAIAADPQANVDFYAGLWDFDGQTDRKL
jgi:catechol 2,3-dioxygenase-like lactoylglutathione lyase family enzyme